MARGGAQIMPTLNRQFIDSGIQAPASGQRFYRDYELPGFAIRVTRNSKSYILEKRVGGANKRITIGKVSEMSLDAARKQAQIMLGEIAKGNDPRTGKRINGRNDITLPEVVEKYLEVKPLGPATQKNYRSSIYLHCSDWLDIPESLAVLCKVRAICGINFKLHDLRRTFLKGQPG